MSMPKRWPEKVMTSLSTETREALDTLALERSTSISALMRQAIDRFVAQETQEAPHQVLLSELPEYKDHEALSASQVNICAQCLDGTHEEHA